MGTPEARKERIGVFLCHCGRNISDTVDVAEVARRTAALPGVAIVQETRFLCAESGQRLIKEEIEKNELTHVVVGACSPLMHELTFWEVCREANLNPFTLNMANIREQVAWVTPDLAEATEKAFALVSAAVHRVRLQRPLEARPLPVERRALVIGGGIAGLEAALRLADAGIPVVLVEREATLGGHMAMVDRTFPTLDCSACILVPRMARVADHPLITVMTLSEIEEVSGHAGAFRVLVRTRPRYINTEACTACASCVDVCPVRDVPSEFDLGLGTRPAIHFPFPQSVPHIPVLDPENCLRFQGDTCQRCAEACITDAVDFGQKEQLTELRVGAVIVATGFGLFDPRRAPEYGYGRWPDVITSLEFERLCHPSGPTGGRILCADGRTPRTLAILHCVGSRDSRFNVHCSVVCCMASLKFAMAARRLTGARVFNFYLDLRGSGADSEEFYRRTQDEGVIFVRGRGTEVIQRAGKLLVKAEDTVLGRRVIVPVDMVVLSVGMEPADGASALAKLFGVGCGESGFYLAKHVKLAPVETVSAGVFLAGACQGPKNIADSVAQAGSAAANVLDLLSRGTMELIPTVATIDAERCAGCGLCAVECPDQAIELVREGERRVARVNPVACRGCGSCAAGCPSGAATQLGYTDEQLLAEITGLLAPGSRSGSPPAGPAIEVSQASSSS